MEDGFRMLSPCLPERPEGGETGSSTGPRHSALSERPVINISMLKNNQGRDEILNEQGRVSPRRAGLKPHRAFKGVEGE